ncbi:hypothetical protein AeMF1_016635, partial [Aphanomyces euteiches]
MPVPLTINGHPVDQIKLDDVYYAVFAKNYVKSSVARENNRSAHCLDLDWIGQSAQGPPEANADSNTTDVKKAKTGKVIDLSEVNAGTKDQQYEPAVEPPLQDDPMGAQLDSSKTNNNDIQNEPPSEQARASNSFLKPKKTSKRKQEDLAKSCASENLFDHLRDLQLKTLLVKFSD